MLNTDVTHHFTRRVNTDSLPRLHYASTQNCMNLKTMLKDSFNVTKRIYKKPFCGSNNPNNVVTSNLQSLTIIEKTILAC